MPAGMMRNARGLVIQGWDGLDSYHLYGAMPSAATNGRRGDVADPLTMAAGPSTLEGSSDKPWHPDSPLFWFGMLLAASLGFIAASTSIRVGPFKAAVAAGK
jgi:hypothetical protein